MAQRGESLTINISPEGNHVGFYAKLTETVYKEMVNNPDSDDWSITFDSSLKRAVLKSSTGQYDVAVVEVNKDERFYALQKDVEAKSLDAVAPITSKLTVENTLTRSSIMSFAEKTDTERKKGIQSSKISDDLRVKKGSLKDQRSTFRNSTTFSKSIRRSASTESHQPSPSHSALPSSVTSSTSFSPPNDLTPNASPHTNGTGAEVTKKEFKFKLPPKRKADPADANEHPSKKQKTSEDSSVVGHNFGFLSKFSELAGQIHFTITDRDRPPRRAPPSSLEQFELCQNEYAEKYRQYGQILQALEQNKSDFVELGKLYNSKVGNQSSPNEKKELESKIVTLSAERKEIVDRLRRRYNYLHSELRDITDSLNEFLKAWAGSQ